MREDGADFAADNNLTMSWSTFEYATDVDVDVSLDTGQTIGVHLVMPPGMQLGGVHRGGRVRRWFLGGRGGGWRKCLWYGKRGGGASRWTPAPPGRSATTPYAAPPSIPQPCAPPTSPGHATIRSPAVLTVGHADADRVVVDERGCESQRCWSDRDLIRGSDGLPGVAAPRPRT